MRMRCLSAIDKTLSAVAVVATLALTSVPVFAQAATNTSKLDDVLKLRAADLRGRSRVIVEYVDAAERTRVCQLRVAQ